MILRNGSAIVVEIAPETSNLDLFLIFWRKLWTNFSCSSLHSKVQQLRSFLHAAEQDLRSWTATQNRKEYVHGRSKKGHMRKFDIKSEEASPEHPWMRRISLIILQNKSSRIQETFHKAGWGSPTFVLGGSFTPPLGIATLPSIGVNPSGQTPLGGPEIVSLK